MLRVGQQGGGRRGGRGGRAVQPVQASVRALPHEARGARRRHDRLLRLALLLRRRQYHLHIIYFLHIHIKTLTHTPQLSRCVVYEMSSSIITLGDWLYCLF